MGKASKRTRKFESKHLKDELARRKLYKKIRKGKEKKAASAEEEIKEPTLENMNADSFMEEGFWKELEGSSSEEEPEFEPELDGGNEEEFEEEIPKSKAAAKAPLPVLKGKTAGQKHKEELEYLKTADPSFVKFLEKSGDNALAFELSDDEEEEEEEEGDEEGVTKSAVPSGRVRLTVLREWIRVAEIPLERNKEKMDNEKGLTPFTALKSLLSAFRRMVRAENPEEVCDAETFNEMMVWALPTIPQLFTAHLFAEDKKKKKKTEKKGTEKPHESPLWPKYAQGIRSYVTSLRAFLQGAVDPEMVRFVVQHMEAMIPFLPSFPKEALKLLRLFLNLWASSDLPVRIVAFLCIRALGIHMPFNFLERCLKGVYLTYVRNVKFVNPKTLSLVTFLSNCVVELYGIDFVSTYQHAFVYIRQLAIHLRMYLQGEAGKGKSKKDIFNWQFFNSLKVWAKLLIAYPTQTELQPLRYPVIQLITGLVRQVSSSKYFPLRFHCIRLLNELADTTETFIPVAPYALEVLQSSEFEKKAKGSSKSVDFETTLKVQKSVLHTKVYQDKLVEEVYDTMLHYFSIYADSVAFPELALPAIIQIKKFNKECKIFPLKKKMQLLLDQLEKNSQYISGKRQGNLKPTDITQLKSFLPSPKPNALKQFYAQHRHNMELIRQQQLAAAAEKEERTEKQSSDEESAEEDILRGDEGMEEENGEEENDSDDSLAEMEKESEGEVDEEEGVEEMEGELEADESEDDIFAQMERASDEEEEATPPPKKGKETPKPLQQNGAEKHHKQKAHPNKTQHKEKGSQNGTSKKRANSPAPQKGKKKQKLSK